LRAVAVFGVLLAHLVSIEAKSGGQTLLSPSFHFGMAGVDLFFTISGFVMVHTTWGIERGGRSVVPFLFARATRIYPLYWIVTAALIPVWLYRPALVFGSIVGEPDIVRNLLLWPDARPPLLAVGWTLVHEVFFYLVFSISLLFGRRWSLAFLVGWAAVVLAGSVLGAGALNPLAAVVFNPLSLEFIGGALAALAFRTLRPTHGRGVLVIAVAWFALALVWAARNTWVFDDQWARTLTFGVPCALLAFGVARAEVGALSFWSWLSVMGDCSYSLYLTHVLSMTALSMIWWPFASAGVEDNVIVLPILTVGAVVIGFSVWNWIERPLLLRLRSFSDGWKILRRPQTLGELSAEGTISLSSPAARVRLS